jgi:hypothetical protein
MTKAEIIKACKSTIYERNKDTDYVTVKVCITAYDRGDEDAIITPY